MSGVVNKQLVKVECNEQVHKVLLEIIEEAKSVSNNVETLSISVVVELETRNKTHEESLGLSGVEGNITIGDTAVLVDLGLVGWHSSVLKVGRFWLFIVDCDFRFCWIRILRIILLSESSHLVCFSGASSSVQDTSVRVNKVLQTVAV